jgi:hypothetical protein
MFLDRKALAYKHVIDGRRIVSRQREVIGLGGNCGPAEELLVSFERSLAIFEHDLARYEA